ncbi:MAG: hypothetical protein J0H98_09150 [Solirubrobacterales bacterium]|nr:hypothetical protein [Solirubrobacterales bacterium]
MTNRITSPVVGLLLGLAMMFGLLAQPAVAANKVPANLRVVTWKGKIVFDGTVKTGTAKIKPNTDCLGGSAGPARTVTGATALGLLYQASLRYKALRPLKLSDGDYGFGICGIGGQAAKDKEWWVLRQNYKDTMTGAETTKVKRGDKILLYLAKSYEETTPDSLFLNAPAKVRRGASVKVRVWSYDGKGKRTPAAGAKVGGAAGALTNVQGFTTLKITRRTNLVARSGSLIPSNRVRVAIRK